jgi:hypothetical protein
LNTLFAEEARGVIGNLSVSYELGNGADFSVRKAYLQHKSGLESSVKLAAIGHTIG